MRRVLVLVLLAAVLGAPALFASAGRVAAEPAPPPGLKDWSKNSPWVKDEVLKYFWHPSGELKLASRHDTWKGGVVSLGQATFSDYTPAQEGMPEYLWAPTCKPGPQTVRISREFKVPGRPADFEITAGFYPGSPANAIQSIEVQVNNTSVFRTTREVHKQDQKASERAAFKYGKNTISITAKKKATGACNVGFYVFVFAKFRADIALKADLPAQPTPLEPLKFTLVNKGPSHFPITTGFSFSTNLSPLLKPRGLASGLLVKVDSDLQLPGSNKCTTAQEGTTYCTFGELAPREQVVVTVYFSWCPTATNPEQKCSFEPAKREFFMQWSAAGYQDLTANNSGSKTALACVGIPAHTCKRTP
jgi:hypothetical protein